MTACKHDRPEGLHDYRQRTEASQSAPSKDSDCGSAESWPHVTLSIEYLKLRHQVRGLLFHLKGNPQF